MDQSPGREREVLIRLRYREGDKQLSKGEIYKVLGDIIDVLNCRKDITLVERREKDGKSGVYVKTYQSSGT